jgi:molecular chaperone DnaK
MNSKKLINIYLKGKIMKTQIDKTEYYLGIDLGTTTTQMAVLDKTGISKILPNMDGDLVTPSIVSVADNRPVVGKAARQDRFFNPDMYTEQFKKYMGEVTENGKPIVVIISPDGTEYTPVTLTAELLRYIKISAEKVEGRVFYKVEISVPAYFGYRARQATRDAGLIAGFEEVYIVDEPTAAATCYGLVKPKDQRIAVFDFGGGTFDISILKTSQDGSIEPLAVDGNPECGGSSIDEAVFQRVRTFVKDKGGLLSAEKDPAQWLEVLDECKQAKELLARKDTALIPLKIADVRTSMQITYEQLKEYSSPVIQTLKDCCKRAIEKSGLKPEQIESVLTVGGSSRLRFVPEIVKEIFGKDPVTDTDPDMAVAKGNAIIAAAHFAAPDEQIIVEGTRYLASVIKDHKIAARDLCLAVVTKEDQGDHTEYNSAIIPAGSKLPFEDTQYFTPTNSGTNAVNVKVIDGKPGDKSDRYVPLQQAQVSVQPTDDENNINRIEVKTRMDEEALVSIEVRDKILNRPVPIKFKFSAGLSESDIEQLKDKLRKRHE